MFLALFLKRHIKRLFFDHQLDLFGGKSSKQKNIVNQYSSVHYTPAFIARSIVENSLKQLDLEKPTLKIMAQVVVHQNLLWRLSSN